jgi:hypothetical protein
MLARWTPFATWHELYQSDLQSLYALWAAPVLFLFYWLLSRPRGERAVDARAISFVNAYAPLFAVETLLDPFATGPLLRWLGTAEPLATAWMIAFVLLGDFRVYLLVFFILAPERGAGSAVARAAAWTMVVPVFAYSATQLLGQWHARLPEQTIWIVYEAGFFAVAVFLSLYRLPSLLGPRRFEVLEYLQALLRYVATYYALWALADLLIVVGGYDFGWGLRAIPNQLYYSFWIPFAYVSFFSPRYAAISRAVHTAR